MAELVAWYERQLARYGVMVKTGCPVDSGSLAGLDGDVVVFATGAVPRGATAPGADGPHVHNACEVWGHAEMLGGNVAILGGGQIGIETAVWLAKEGKKVSVIQRSERIMGGLRWSPSGDISMAKHYISYYGIDLRTNASLHSIKPGAVTILEDGIRQVLPADDAVLAIGYQSCDGLFRQMKELAPDRETYLIGDAAHVANVYGAIHEAFKLASTL